MVKRYYEKDLVSTKTVEIFECPDCGFEFNAMHEVDEQVGGWECPLCEVEELKMENEKKHFEILALEAQANGDKKLIERYEEDFEYADRAIYTQYSTMNHMENTEHEKGQISGLITASHIVENAKKKLNK